MCQRSFILVFIAIISISNVFSSELPCDFLDSVNITDGIRNSNGTITYEGQIFPPELYAEIDYIIVNGTLSQSTKNHIRGCICHRVFKPCVRLCCPHGQVFDGTITTGRKCGAHEAATNITVFIENEQSEKNLLQWEDHFGFVDDRPCETFYGLEEHENYSIKSTGNVALSENQRILTHQEYCMLAELDSETNTVSLHLLICHTKEKNDALNNLRYGILPNCMTVSNVFIIITFLVYIWLPELRNLHGKCFANYLLALALGYTSMSIVHYNNGNYLTPIPCQILGFLCYFSFLAAFLWLSVISFDLWFVMRRMYRPKNGSTERLNFYVLLGWGLPSLMTILIFILDNTVMIPKDWRPRIGDNTCFLKDDKFTKTLYFYVPVASVISINILFFILTTISIFRSRRSIDQMTSHGNSSSHQRNDQFFVLYIRLFFMMGVSWIMEIISFFYDKDSIIFLAGDIINSTQGLFIFIFMILKRRTLRSLRTRWQELTHKTIPNGSTRTNSSSITGHASNIPLQSI